MATNVHDYDPKYIDDLSDVPVAGPDDFPNQEKQRAVFEAETRLESDVNNGQEIPQQNLTDTHTLAVLLFATYRLQAQIEDPTDVRLGDAHNDGTVREERASFGSHYKTDYEELVDRINQRSEAGSPGVYFGAVGDGTQTGVATNTRDGDIIDRYPFSENDRFTKSRDN